MQGVASGALNRMPLNREAQVLRFLADRVRRESDCRDALVSVIRLSAADATVAVAAANALTILNRSGVSISACLAASGADLRGIVAPGADLSNAILVGTDCRGADLQRADLSNAGLAGSDFSQCNLQGCILGVLPNLVCVNKVNAIAFVVS